MVPLRKSWTPRSALFLPADREGLVANSRSSNADVVVLDLEDSVVQSRKGRALDATLEQLGDPSNSGSRWVRVNAGALGIAEIDALLSGNPPGGIMLPKAEPTNGATIAAIRAIDQYPSVKLILLIESARGVLGLSKLADLADDALLALGEEDLRADIGIRTTDSTLMYTYRAGLLATSAAFGFTPPLAPAWIHLAEPEAFRLSNLELRDAGYGGRACIHPTQIEPVNDVFGTTTEELDQARRTVLTFEEQAARGIGAFRDDEGVMVDAATVRTARDLLARHIDGPGSTA